MPKNIIKVTKATDFLTICDTKMCTELKNEIIPGMASEEIVEEIAKDMAVIAFGNSICLRYEDDLKQYVHLIRTELRTLIRIRFMMYNIDPQVQTIVEVFDPSKWDTFIECVKKYAHLDEKVIAFKSPTNIQQVGLLFTKVAKFIGASCMLSEEEDFQRKKITAWLEKYEARYKSEVGWQANKLATEKKCQKKKLLSLASDMIKLNNHVNSMIESSKEILKGGYNQIAFENLNKAVMVSVLLFNRKRVGEMRTLIVKDFLNRRKVGKDSEIYKGLSESDKKFSLNYFHLTV